MPNMYIYSWLSHSMVHIPPQNDPNHICFFVFIGEKNGGDHPVEAGKKKKQHLLRKHWILLGSFLHLSAQRTRGSSRTRTLYMELMEKPKSRSLSIDQCLPHLMCIQSPGGLARIQCLMQWVWAAVWDSVHLTELPGDNSALDLNLSSDYLLFIFPRLFIIPGNTTC